MSAYYAQALSEGTALKREEVNMLLKKKSFWKAEEETIDPKASKDSVLQDGKTGAQRAEVPQTG